MPYVPFAPGDRVMHEQYGDGTLVSVNEFHTVIEFDAHGRRTFSSPRVVLTTSSTPAPAKPIRKRTTKKAAVDPPPTPSAS